MRLAIGGPTRTNGPVSFAVDLAQLYAKSRESGPWGHHVTVGFIESTYIHAGREMFLEESLKQGATHVLWLDTDMTFPPETANWLVQHERSVVAANYVTRDGSSKFTARRDRIRIPTTEESTGLEEVHEVGMGVFMMDTMALHGLPRPWFRHGVNEQRADIGEDIMFCRALREAGHKIYIDHDLSKRVGHVGQRTYRYTDSEVAIAV